MDTKKAHLADLRRELWLRKRNRGEIVWTTKNGKNIPINEMTDSHLENTINMLERVDELEENMFDIDF